MSSSFDTPRQSNALRNGDIVYVRTVFIKKRFLRKEEKIIHHSIAGIIIGFTFTDAGWVAQIQLYDDSVITCDPVDIVLVKKIETQIDALEAEIMEFLQREERL